MVLLEEHGSLLGETDPRELCWLISKLRKEQGGQGTGLLPWVTHCVIVGKSFNFSVPEVSPNFSKYENLQPALATLQIYGEEVRGVTSMKVPWKAYFIHVEGSITMHVFSI